MSTTPRALVLRAPGINCDRETALACRLAGFETDLVHINQLRKTPEKLLQYHFLAVPGGFSYGDDLGAGNLLGKNLHVHLEKELEQFVDEGRPVLGICNGFQALVRAGLLPAGLTSTCTENACVATLAENASAHYECRWIKLAPQAGPCIFTKGIEGTFELPVGHGEGQFVLANPAMLEQLQANGQAALLYTTDAPTTSEQELPYPANPNGSMGQIAGVCNARGNVMGMMPHPDRFIHTNLHPQRRGTNGEGDGMLIFKNAYKYVQDAYVQGPRWRQALHSGAPEASSGPITQTSLPREHLSVETDLASVSPTTSSYSASGVDIAAADNALAMVKDAVRATHGPEVVAGMGAFAGVFRATALKEMKQPALVASMDGVGTKTLLASQAGRFETIGHDIVNHSINDLLTQKATPLFFMDYVATGKLAPEQIAAVVKSVATACKEADCALLGGETAEMPGVYHEDAFDLAGTIVGAVDLAEGWQNGATLRPGDVLLGLPSNGLHTNGYSLARRVFAQYALDTVLPELGESLGDALLRPHRCYLRELQKLHQQVEIKGLAHITGGGFAGNISRILPAGIGANIETGAWQVPPIFGLIARLGKVERDEMYRTFNMGVGMILALAPDMADKARRVLPELLTVGKITAGNGVTLL